MRCPGCRHANRERARFCEECGWELPAESAPASAPGNARSYTPRHLAEKILTTRSALVGEHKQVTVLFADVESSLQLAEQVDPEEWHRILDRLIRVLAEGVHRFEGTVNQYTGDGIMALFGAPIAHEDHARRACLAALHIARGLRRLADELAHTHGLRLSVRMGLNSGEVVVGTIGDDLRMDYTAQGHMVGLAARVERLASPQTAWLSEHTAELVRGFFELKDLGEFEIAGVREPVRLYELEGAGPLRTRLDVSRAHGFTPFVGRSEAVAALEALFEHGAGREGRIAQVVGVAGVGKSRLCLEFLEGCRSRGASVYEAHCPAHGRSVPLLPVRELVRSLCGVDECDPEDQARAAIRRTLQALPGGVDDRPESLPLISDLLGVPDPRRPPPGLTPEDRLGRLLALVERLVEGDRARTAIFYVDDLHWIDRESEVYLARVADAVSRTGGLLLVNHRPDYAPSWLDFPQRHTLAIETLGAEDTGRVVRALLGEGAPPQPELEALVHAHTGGNPFFVEELIRSLVESGRLGAGGTAPLSSVEEIEIPATVMAVVQARIDRLPDREKRVLQIASVIGRRFEAGVLKRVAELGDEELTASLGALRAADFVEEESIYPEPVYVFRHPLTQAMAYDSQLGDRRAELHAEVACAIEDHAERLGEKADLLAHHWEEARVPSEARRWRRRAAFGVTHIQLPRRRSRWRGR